ncbi:hypothetical protein SLS62_007115 [Diatrype stigma]|uniref:Cellulase n=1 Tax=Diatrype stigma TaxID=117547 RepID=A0AAN9UPN7_9PEZI
MSLLAKTLLGTAALAATAAAADAPSLPLSTSGRWILDAGGARVKLRCINWAGHMEAHIPEGLHKQPVETIAGAIADQGFNCVRLTYSIDHALAPDLKVGDAFAAVADAAGISKDDADGLYGNVTEKNAFVAEGGDGGGGATTSDVYAAVIKALWDRGVMTILDNHVSKASWCCGSSPSPLSLCSFFFSEKGVGDSYSLSPPPFTPSYS